MFDNVIVPLDGSALAEHAVNTAGDLAKRSGGLLKLIHVDTPFNSIFVEGLPVIERDLHVLRGYHERVYLERLTSRVGKDWGLEATYEVLREKESLVATNIARYVRAVHNPLLVMTTHGRSGFSHMWLGSVAEQLVRWSEVPVLLLRVETGVLEMGATRSALDPFRRLLIAVDGSPFSDQILGPALQLGALYGAEFEFVHVVRNAPWYERVVGGDVMAAGPEWSREHRARAQATIDSASESVRAAGHRVSAKLIESDHVALALSREAMTTPGTVIAMATHGHGLTRMFTGSVTDKVLRSSPVPVLTFCPKQ